MPILRAIEFFADQLWVAVARVVLERHHRKVFTHFHEGQRVNTTALFG